MARIKTASAKAKGRGLQDKVLALVLTAFNAAGYPVEHNEDLRTAIMGEKGNDVQMLSSLGKWLWPFDTECKNRQSGSIWEWMKQAEEKGTAIPLVIFTRNRSKTYACMDVEDLIRLMVERASKDTSWQQASDVVHTISDDAFWTYSEEDRELLKSVLTNALAYRPDLIAKLQGTEVVPKEK